MFCYFLHINFVVHAWICTMLCLDKIAVFLQMNKQYNINIKDNNRDSAILSKDLNLISNWTFRWKISFNPDPPKQATKTVFF